MSILTLQKRLRLIGRIRAGDKGPKGNPRKLSTWRLTSPQANVIEQAASLWGGQIQPWDGPNGAEWEVVTNTNTLTVIIPSGQSISQHYETWTAAGCTARCDGVTELLTDTPCHCDPDPELRECKPTTRFNVLLPDLSDIGQWRLDTRGWWAATELGGLAELLSMAEVGYIRARLRLEQREVRRPGKPVRKFAVPVVEMDANLGRVLEALGVGQSFTAAPQIEAGERLQLATSTPTHQVDPDEAWAELTSLLGPDVDPDDTMPVLESRMRRLYELMEQVGVWSGTSHGDPLHLALRKHEDAAHVGDLRKDRLVAFCEVSWEAARDAVGKADQ